MKEFARALLASQLDSLTCAACQAQLPDYVTTLMLDGDKAQANFTAVLQHLQQCPACSRAADELITLMELGMEEVTPAVEVRPQFDFSFLENPIQPAQPASVTHWWENAGKLVLRLSAELLGVLQPPPLQPALIGVKTGETEETLAVWNMDQSAYDLRATVTISQRAGQTQFCSVVVGVEMPSRGEWPHLADIEVTLKQAEVVLARKETDPFGKALFQDIPQANLAGLIIEIVPD